jgi:hypothetical protein
MSAGVARVLALVALEGQKAAAIHVVHKIGLAKAHALPSWWRWTAGLACALAIRRIEEIPLDIPHSVSRW